MTNQCPRATVRTYVAPGIIRGAERWHDFFTRVDAVRANDMLPKPVSTYRIRELDTVSIKHELLANAFRIPRGSFGVVTHARDNGRLLDVRFFRNPRICITLRADDLKVAL